VSPSNAGAQLLVLEIRAALLKPREARGKDTAGRLKYGAARKTKDNGRDHLSGMECYFDKRYFALTDKHLDGTPTELRLVPTADLIWLIHIACTARRSPDVSQ
jgi:hypothetical protein